MRFLLAAALAVVVATPARAIGPEARCQADKGKEAGTYAACLYRAGSALLRSRGSCAGSSLECYRDLDCDAGDSCRKDTSAGSRYADALAKCSARFDSQWDRVDDDALPAFCPDGLAAPDVRDAIGAGVDDILAALGGDGLADCAGALDDCNDGAAACGAALQSCSASLADTRAALSACNGDPGTCASGAVCTAPGAPEGVTATPGDGRVNLSWAAIDGAAGYRIARGGGSSGPFAPLGRTAGTAFVDTTVTNGIPAWYVVVAMRDGFEGPPSSPVSATPVSTPALPSLLTATGEDGRVQLSWTKGARASQTAVLRAASAAGAAEEVAVVDGDAWTDEGRTNGTPSWYALVSRNAVGESAPTSRVQAIPIAAPSNLAAVAGDGQVALFWDAGAGSVSWEVEVAEDAEGPFVPLASPAQPRFAHSGLVNGIVRRYRVAARSAVGRSAWSEAVAATASADADPLPAADDPARNRVGLNVWFNNDWSGASSFVDVFKESRPWQDAANWNNPVGGTDALGWPTADASTVLFSGSPSDFNGTYRLVFEGQATVSVMWCPGSVANKAWDPATNTTTADVTFAMTSSGSVGLVFRNTRRTADSATNTGFRNVRLYRPGYPSDGSVVFTAPFLAALGKAGAVRLMDWTGASSNVVEHWADRVTPNHATQAGLLGPVYTAPDGATYRQPLGVALEHQVQLCNALMLDCWITVPPVADDEFVQKMALALRFGTDGREPYTSAQAHPVYPPLNPALRLYVEYSNETWNSGSGFLAFHIIQAICAHLPASHPVMTPAPDSIYTAVWRYPAWKAATISETFRAVFGDAAMMTRVRPVLMTQRGNAQNTLGAALTWLDGWLSSLPTPKAMKDVIHGAGGSGYYGANAMVSADPDQFFAPGNYPDSYSLRDFALDAVWTRNYGLRRVAYEGGPGLSFSAADNRNLNADPRMQDMVETAHDAWSGFGGDLLMYYVVRGPSEWEFTPAITNADTPKLRALQELQARPRAAVSAGASLPGTMIARVSDGTRIRTGFGYTLTIDGEVTESGNPAGTFSAQAAHADAAYSGTLVIHGYASSTTRVAVWINGVRQGEVTLAGLSGTRHLYDSSPLAVDVPAGLVVVRLEVLAGDLTVHSIRL